MDGHPSPRLDDLKLCAAADLDVRLLDADLDASHRIKLPAIEPPAVPST